MPYVIEVRHKTNPHKGLTQFVHATRDESTSNPNNARWFASLKQARTECVRLAKEYHKFTFTPVALEELP